MSEKKPASKRIIALDLMRGYFLVAILLDHLMYFPNGLDWLSGRGWLYVSAAEGFFFISGLVLGIVRGRKLVEKPFKQVAKLLLKRGWQLYVTAIVLFFIFTFIGWFFIDNPGVKAGLRPLDQSFLEIIWGALTFQYIYGWADYLRLYAIYMFVSPIVMWLLRKGKWWLVLLGSLAVWYYYNFSFLPAGELSQVFSWQIIFFGGMVMGFHLDQIRDWWRARSKMFRQSVTVSTVSLAAITMVTNFIFAIFGAKILGGDTASAINSVLVPFFEKDRLPLTRIAMFLVWFGGSFWLFRTFEDNIRQWFGWILERFGTHSLYVYTVEAFVIFAIHLIVPPDGTNGLLLNLGLTLISLALVWLAVRYKFLARIIPR